MRTPRTPAELHAVQEEILAAALAIVHEAGVRTLTMRELGRRTGMTAGHLYNFFASKEAIVLTLQLRGFADLERALQASGSPSRTPEANARAYLRAYVDWALANRSRYEIMFAAGLPKYSDFRATPLEALAQEEHAASMRVAASGAAVLQSVLAHVPRKQRAEWLAAVWSLLHGAVSLEISGNLGYLDSDAHAVVARVWAGLTPLLAKPKTRSRR